jgi:hypothetical protein
MKNLKKKDNEKYERFKREEEERRLIDQEEALFREKKNQEIIAKANRMIFE